METRCRIPIWQTFERIQWHVIPEPRITLQGAPLGEFTVAIPDSRATLQGVRIPSAIIENRLSPYFIFLCLMQFWF